MPRVNGNSPGQPIRSSPRHHRAVRRPVDRVDLEPGQRGEVRVAYLAAWSNRRCQRSLSVSMMLPPEGPCSPLQARGKIVGRPTIFSVARRGGSRHPPGRGGLVPGVRGAGRGGRGGHQARSEKRNFCATDERVPSSLKSARPGTASRAAGPGRHGGAPGPDSRKCGRSCRITRVFSRTPRPAPTWCSCRVSDARSARPRCSRRLRGTSSRGIRWAPLVRFIGVPGMTLTRPKSCSRAFTPSSPAGSGGWSTTTKPRTRSHPRPSSGCWPGGPGWTARKVISI